MKLIREITAWPFLTVLVCSTLLTYVIPPEWIRAVPVLHQLTKWIAAHVPGVAAYIRHSDFPAVAEIYFPFMLLISPLHFVWIWRQEDQHILWRNLISTKPLLTFFRILVASAVLLLVGISSFKWGGTQLDVVPWNESKIALCLAGHAAAGGGFFILLDLPP